MACRSESNMQEDKQIDGRMEIPKMKLREFDNITKVVKEHGGTEAWKELEWLLKLAKTNFAACYGSETQGVDVQDEAVTRLSTMLPLIDGDGEYLRRICKWLYAQTKEKCTCQAPLFITGCDNAVSTGEDSEDVCTCTTGECPWTLHTGVFL